MAQMTSITTHYTPRIHCFSSAFLKVIRKLGNVVSYIPLAKYFTHNRRFAPIPENIHILEPGPYPYEPPP